MQNKKKLFIGVTGGIGSGKSLVCEYFEKLGCKILHADLIAKEIYKTDSALKNLLKKEFGDAVFDSSNEIDIQSLRKIVFSDKVLQKRVNKIVHPFVIKETHRQVQLAKERIVIKEAALIFESKSDRDLDYTILVFADKKTRLKRVMKRDKIPASKILEIMKLQMPEREKIKRADFVLMSNSSKSELFREVKFLHNLFLKILDN